MFCGILRFFFHKLCECIFVFHSPEFLFFFSSCYTMHPCMYVQVLSPSAIAVRSPPATMPGEVDLTLIFRATGAQFCMTNPGKFIYTGKRNAKEMHTQKTSSDCRHELIHGSHCQPVLTLRTIEH